MDGGGGRGDAVGDKVGAAVGDPVGDAVGDPVVQVDGRRWPLAGAVLLTVGRDAGSDIRVDHPEVSRRHAEVRREPAGWVLRDVGSANGLWVGARRVGWVPLDASVTVALGPDPAAPRLEITVDVTRERALQGPDDERRHPDIPYVVGPGDPHPTGGTLVTGSRPGATVTIGRAADNDLVIDDLLASRHHARATARPGATGPTGAPDGGSPGAFWIEDLASLNGTYINGAPISAAMLHPGDLLTIGHLEFHVQDGALLMAPQRRQVSVVARDLGVTLPGGKQLLADVSFELPESSLLAVIGPSGAGKSTLLAALTGTRKATAGSVSFGGRDLWDNYRELRRRIGVVPQDDVVHPQLTVRQALDYASQLRFPADLDPADRRARIDAVIAELGLTAHADTRVDRLSGGQRKRTSVALELLTEPSLLFLDEPTSGLDPGLDKSVMRTLRGLADGGRTVVVITHSVANLGLCDLVLLLAPGGRVAYVGPPQRVLAHFGRSDYSDVFADVAADPRGAADRFAQVSAATRALPVEPPTPGPAAPPLRQQSLARQTLTLVRRHARVLASDRSYALFQALLPLVLAALVVTVPGSAGFGWPRPPELGEASQLLVILIVGAAFMGVSSSSRDLVGERSIYRREKAVGLAPTAYLASKLVVFGLLAAAQSAVLVGLVLAVKAGPGDGVLLPGPVELWIAVAATACCSAILGLLISAVVSTSEQVMPLLVVATMAQLVLCGGLIPVAGRVGLEQLAWLAPSRWGFAAAASSIDLTAMRAATTPAGAPAPAVDELWAHTPAQWGFALAMLALLGAAAATVAALRLRRIDRQG